MYVYLLWIETSLYLSNEDIKRTVKMHYSGIFKLNLCVYSHMNILKSIVETLAIVLISAYRSMQTLKKTFKQLLYKSALEKLI